MPKYVIERELPGAGKLSRGELQAISQKSCGVLRNLGSQIQWVESFVTDDKIYCVYVAPNEEKVREHDRQGGFPANQDLRSEIGHRSDHCRTTMASSSRSATLDTPHAILVAPWLSDNFFAGDRITLQEAGDSKED